MVQSTYTIEFDIPIDLSHIIVHLKADVEIDLESHYTITNIRTEKHEAVLPTLVLKRKNGKWVHIDTEKETNLSKSVGLSIEKMLIPISKAADL